MIRVKYSRVTHFLLRSHGQAPAELGQVSAHLTCHAILPFWREYDADIFIDILKSPRNDRVSEQCDISYCTIYTVILLLTAILANFDLSSPSSPQTHRLLRLCSRACYVYANFESGQTRHQAMSMPKCRSIVMR